MTERSIFGGGTLRLSMLRGSVLRKGSVRTLKAKPFLASVTRPSDDAPGHPGDPLPAGTERLIGEAMAQGHETHPWQL